MISKRPGAFCGGALCSCPSCTRGYVLPTANGDAPTFMGRGNFKALYAPRPPMGDYRQTVFHGKRACG